MNRRSFLASILGAPAAAYAVVGASNEATAPGGTEEATGGTTVCPHTGDVLIWNEWYDTPAGRLFLEGKWADGP